MATDGAPRKVAVKVTHVQNPYLMRIYESEGRTEAITALGEELSSVLRERDLQGYDEATPRIGDSVLIQNSRGFEADLPAWQCRGVITSYDRLDSKYGVLLQDHGFVVGLRQKDLRILPEGLIDADFLTFDVAVAHVVPIAPSDTGVCTVDQWTKLATQYTRDLLSSASNIFFEELGTLKPGHKYGELYIVLENEIVVLSESLVLNEYAQYVNDEVPKVDRSFARGLLDPVIKLKNQSDLSSSDNDQWTACKPSRGAHRGILQAVYPRAFNSTSKSKLSAENKEEMFVHGPATCEPVRVMTEARFAPSIHKVLDSKKFLRPTRVQSYLWPTISRRLDVIAVSPAKSGKTLAYLAPICASIINSEPYSKKNLSQNQMVFKPSGKPSALILCSSAIEVSQVHSTCGELLHGYSAIKILAAYNGLSERSLAAQIHNGCEIFVSTVPLLARLLKIRDLIDFGKLRYFVIDQAHVILEKYEPALNIIFAAQTAFGSTSQTSSPDPKVRLQHVVLAQHWTPPLKKFAAARLPGAQILINSYFEAAVYARVLPKLMILPREQKIKKITEILSDGTSTMIKTIIICTSNDEVIELEAALKASSIDTLVAHGNMVFYKIQGVAEAWMASVSGKYPVLVCSDEVLSDLNIRDSRKLIHYSIPPRTKSEFYYRFAVLSNHYYSKAGPSKNDARYPSVVIMVDESNDFQLNGLWIAALRLRAKPNPAMTEYLEKIFVSLEMSRSNYSFCQSIKALGYCPDKGSCGERHRIISTADKPTTDIKIGDWVRLVVTYVHAANHFSARITAYTDGRTNKSTEFSFSELMELSIMMQKRYSVASNRRPVKDIEVGDVCAVEGAPGEYKRVRILRVKVTGKLGNQTAVVRCIEDGDQLSVRKSQLMELPESLQKWPSHVVDVYLTGVIPLDNETRWSPCANEVAYNWMQRNPSPTAYLYGKVVLHLGSDMWVDPLQLRYEMIRKEFADCAIESSLKTELIKKNCGVANDKHISYLTNLVKNSGMEIDQENEMDNVEE